ncbi:hypothetical protein C4X99_18530 [Leptospira interrogans serovar Geyaweera]|uniref:Leucine rich repeat protein n=1 Tax=Leptospira interrogans serogroup Icterohaemorrhagiae serovar Lai (strain 56601) TaxID=189518 RepID=D4YVX5_LEPIN|nr:hypothetical protein LA_2444a [Leptospira interrogans serovar Lai str. 56601]AER02798.1 hypothetical protein LIF_A2006 [Leptospira interrogans serovar Lai str. IPAV]EKR28937.1 leucine rich repeat protein [Leptospira interrogans serovar Bataviae str. L1111]KAA1292059.1 hypothetical protein C4X99_18530 [Leptospira interrogans serovar Geyaweera]
MDSYGNRLETFPQGIEQLQKLEELNLSKNQFLSVPFARFKQKKLNLKLNKDVSKNRSTFLF